MAPEAGEKVPTKEHNWNVQCMRCAITVFYPTIALVAAVAGKATSLTEVDQIHVDHWGSTLIY